MSTTDYNSKTKVKELDDDYLSDITSNKLNQIKEVADENINNSDDDLIDISLDFSTQKNDLSTYDSRKMKPEPISLYSRREDDIELSHSSSIKRLITPQNSNPVANFNDLENLNAK